MTKKERAKQVYERLNDVYTDAECTLDFADHFELLLGGILAAQSTDQRVNMVLPALLHDFPTPAAMAAVEPETLWPYIQSVGLYKAKAKALVGSSRRLVSHFAGKVPDGMDDLLSLPGVGRKIANLIRGDGFGIPGVVVDTHCGRIVRRIGLTSETNPAKVERDLEKILLPEWYIRFGHLMVAHGRAVCTAKKPQCATCFLRPVCKQIGV